ncbi:MAG TPA: DGQHR domain-containing protein [Nitrososphaerales archaeon]|nr:DGQHR domain-containing protein [Nitrososphaerales archaeon]
MIAQNLEVPVVKTDEGGVTSYLGRMRASDVLAVYDIRRWSETELDGYQRQLYEERKKEVAKYLRECPIPVVPAILATIGEETEFDPYEKRGPLGYLRMPARKGAIYLIDGQHRMAGFQWFLDQLSMSEENKRLGVPNEMDDRELEHYRQILSYEVPILFIDGNQAASLVKSTEKPDGKPTEKRDVERALFLILNKTQKGIRPSLKDSLQYMIWRSGINGIPGLEDVDRVKATELVLKLNSNGSPLSGMINPSGARGMQRPVQLSSFVTSLEPLYDNEKFARLSDQEKYQFVKTYWSVLREMYPLAFEKEDWRKHLVLKTVGVYVLNRVARDFLGWTEDNSIQVSAESIKKYLSPLKDFDWNRDNSPFKGMQGLGGVDVAYDKIREFLPEGSQKTEAKRRPRVTSQEVS